MRKIKINPIGFLVGCIFALAALFLLSRMSNIEGANQEPKLVVRSSEELLEPIEPTITQTKPSERQIYASGATISPTLASHDPSKDALIGFCLKVPVLLYHHIEPVVLAKQEGHAQLTVDSQIFDAQMSYLKSSGYTSITADQLVTALKYKSNLPPKSVVVTLDDGYVDAFTSAFPVARKYQIFLNLMIPTGLLENKGYLSWNNLKEMVSSGLVTAYDHTWSHAALASASQDKIEMEVHTAKKQLEDNLGKQQTIFTYPYGSESNKVVEVLKKDGFIAAFSTIGGITQCDSIIMSLRRIHIGNAPLSSYGL